jgi:hypothetical protein
MKKITFLLITIALITFKTSAQDSKIKFGIQGGLNYSTLRGFETYTDDNPGFAYLFGASFQYQIKENLSIKADLSYERKTQKSKNVLELESDTPQNPFTPGVYHFTNTVFLNYLVLPIMLKYNFSNDKSFYINGGPFVSYLLKSGASTTLNVEGLNNDDIDDTKYRKSLDYGLLAGIGKEFKLNGDHQIYVELRENLGLANIAKSDDLYTYTIKTNSINLIAGYTFN